MPVISKRSREKYGRKRLIGFTLIIIFLSAFIGYNISSLFNQRVAYAEKPVERLVFSNAEGFAAQILVPAVDQGGKGTISKIKVTALPGSGQTLADINSVLFFVDTQNSIRIARDVAQNFTGVDLRSMDLVFSIETNASVIEGPSAGAALAIAIIAALENRPVRQDVMITGTISQGGRIGPAGGIDKKAEAASKAGASLFLIPKGNLFENGFVKTKACRDFEGFRYCETNYVPKGIESIAASNMSILAVSDIKEASNYFIGEMDER